MRLYKSRDQYILKNKKIAEKMVEYAEISDSDCILEVGCGTGVLTEYLIRKAKKVIGIEIDKRFVEYLSKKFGEKLEIIHGDALKVEFPFFDKFVSNIPYSISTPITFKVLQYRKKAVIMYQKEFAERIVATKGKKYGKLSVMVRAYATPKIVQIVSRKNFSPQPDVDSAIVVFDSEPEICVKDLNLFRNFITKCFSMRRKKLAKILKLMNVPENILKKYGDKRAEEITPEEYAKIFNVLYGQ